MLTAINGGGVTDLKTTLALSPAEAKGAFAGRERIGPQFPPARRKSLEQKMPDPAWQGPGMYSH